MGILEDLQSLKKFGLIVDDADARVIRKLSDDDPAYMKESSLSRFVWKAIFAVLRHRTTALSHYSKSVPGKFALLIGDPSDVLKGLQWCKGMWDAVCCFEKERHSHQGISQVWSAAACCEWVLVKEMGNGKPPTLR